MSTNDPTAQAVYDCGRENHYNGYVGDRTWAFDHTDPRSDPYCPECGEDVYIGFVHGNVRDAGGVFALATATPDQVVQLASAWRSYREQAGLPVD